MLGGLAAVIVAVFCGVTGGSGGGSNGDGGELYRDRKSVDGPVPGCDSNGLGSFDSSVSHGMMTGGVYNESGPGISNECACGEPCGVGSSAEKSDASEGSGVVNECGALRLRSISSEIDAPRTRVKGMGSERSAMVVTVIRGL